MAPSAVVECGGPLALSTAAAKAAPQGSVSIAALEALRHPKSSAAPLQLKRSGAQTQTLSFQTQVRYTHVLYASSTAASEEI
jgi:hypothetical protein